MSTMRITTSRLELPIHTYATNTTSILAIRGYGKTYTGSVMRHVFEVGS